MEKTDVESADDKDDQRKIRFLTKKSVYTTILLLPN